MKKFLFTLMFSLIMVFSVFGTLDNVDVNAASMTENYNMYGLGKTVNIAKDGYLNNDSINAAKSIFDQEWLEQRLQSSDVIEETNQSSYTSSFSCTTIEDFKLNLGLTSKYKTSIGGKIFDAFNATVKDSFEFSGDVKLSNYKYRFFYKCYGYYPRYYVNLAGNAIVTEYGKHLDKTYEGYLNLLFRDAISSQIFFDKFGTHVITSGKYGGSFDCTYFAVNNQKEITAEMKADAEADVSAKIFDIVHGGTGGSLQFCAATSYTKLTCAENSNVKSIGGDAFGPVKFEEFDEKIDPWLNSITNETASLIDIPSNGLTPLWEILPPQHLDKIEIFKNKCKEYLLNNSDQLSEFDIALNLGDTFSDNEFHTIRTNEIKINHNKPEDNATDILDLKYDLGEKGFNLFKSEGFTKVKIEITMIMREENDGYQYVYLYNDNSELAKEKCELGTNGKVVKDPTSYTFNFKSISININDIHDGILYIKYGSSGLFQDDWFNKDVSVKVTYFK